MKCPILDLQRMSGLFEKAHENAGQQIRSDTEVEAGCSGTVQGEGYRRPQSISRQACMEGCTPSAAGWFDEAVENGSRVVAL